MLLCIFEDDHVEHLTPLVDTRATYDLRVGARTLAQRIADAFPDTQQIFHARGAVAEVTAQDGERLVNRIPGTVDVLFVNGRWYAESGEVLNEIRTATKSQESVMLVDQDVCVAAWVPNASPEIIQADSLSASTFDSSRTVKVRNSRVVSRLWHLLDLIDEAISEDFEARTRGYNVFERPGADVQEGATLVNGERIYLGRGATIRPGAILNAESGPIYVDENVTVMEQAVVRGPAYLGPNSMVKIGGILESVAIGPWCKVGGEVHHCIFHAYSNKAHAGFLGHSYLGQWCNLGADTNNSNLKNDYGMVSLYNPVLESFENTERQFVGLFMGDHSKSGITTMFNTGSIVGVCCNVYGNGFHSRYVPSFSWGTPDSYVEYRLDKALRVAEAVMARRSVSLSAAERELLERIHAESRNVNRESATA